MSRVRFEHGDISASSRPSQARFEPVGCYFPLDSHYGCCRKRATLAFCGKDRALAPQGPQLEAIETLKRALNDHSAVVRAAAARVINVMRTPALLDELRNTLRGETDLSAALEQTSALVALGGREDDTLFMDVVRRFGGPMASRVALLLARARGPEGVPDLLLLMQELDLSRESRRACFLAATRSNPNAIRSAAVAALEVNQAETWLAALQSAEESDVMLDTAVLSSALQHADPTIAGETAWHLARIFSEKDPGNAAERGPPCQPRTPNRPTSICGSGGSSSHAYSAGRPSRARHGSRLSSRRPAVGWMAPKWRVSSQDI